MFFSIFPHCFKSFSVKILPVIFSTLCIADSRTDVLARFACTVRERERERQRERGRERERQRREQRPPACCYLFAYTWSHGAPYLPELMASSDLNIMFSLVLFSCAANSRTDVRASALCLLACSERRERERERERAPASTLV